MVDVFAIVLLTLLFFCAIVGVERLLRKHYMTSSADKCMHEFIDLETGKTVVVELSPQEFDHWLSEFVEACGPLEILEEN